MRLLSRLLDGVTSGAAVIGAGALGILLLIVVADVFLRTFLHTSVPSAIESQQVTLVFVVFLAMGETQVKKQHIRVDFIIDKMKEKFYMTFNPNGYLVKSVD